MALRHKMPEDAQLFKIIYLLKKKYKLTKC
jgi:hypothetical protein